MCLAGFVLSMLWLVMAFRSQRRFLKTAARATGVVESLKAERWDKETIYLPVIRFTTAGGAAITSTSKTARKSGYRVGQAVRVLYDPAHPDDLEIDAFWSRWLAVIAAGAFALILLGIGAGVFVAR